MAGRVAYHQTHDPFVPALMIIITKIIITPYNSTLFHENGIDEHYFSHKIIPFFKHLIFIKKKGKNGVNLTDACGWVAS